MCGCLSRAPNWGPGLQPRQCPEWESNPLPSGSQSSTQSTEPHQPELIDFCFKSLYTAQNWSDTCVMLPLCRKPHRHCCGLRCVFLLCFSLWKQPGVFGIWWQGVQFWTWLFGVCLGLKKGEESHQVMIILLETDKRKRHKDIRSLALLLLPLPFLVKNQ